MDTLLFILVIAAVVVVPTWWMIMASRRHSLVAAIVSTLVAALLVIALSYPLLNQLWPYTGPNNDHTNMLIAEFDEIMAISIQNTSLENIWSSAWGGQCIVAATDPMSSGYIVVSVPKQEDCSYASVKGIWQTEGAELNIHDVVSLPLWVLGLEAGLIFLGMLIVGILRVKNPKYVPDEADAPLDHDDVDYSELEAAESEAFDSDTALHEIPQDSTEYDEANADATDSTGKDA